MRYPQLSTERRSFVPDRRMTPDHKRKTLVEAGFNHIVVINTDMSVRSRGAIEAAFFNRNDAEAMVARLNAIYSADAFVVENLC